MATTVSINDAGTWRSPYAIYVNDAGTWRLLRYAYVNDAGTWRKVYGYTHNFTGTVAISVTAVGTYGGFNTPQSTNNDSPYLTNGSLTPTAIPLDSLTIANLWDFDGISDSTTLRVSGFGADPGINYFTSLTVNASLGAVTNLMSSATYTYSAGTAQWRWSNLSGLSGSANGAAFSGSILY